MHENARSLAPANILSAKWGKSLGPRSLRSGTSQLLLLPLDSEWGLGAGTQTSKEGAQAGYARPWTRYGPGLGHEISFEQTIQKAVVL